MDKFPFIRLLGDTQLEDDEYIVIYRAPQGKNTGHHFIRIDSDATVREKDANGEPRIFENWGTLNDEPEAVFAVKKEHKIFDYSTDDINLKNNNGLDFDGSVAQAVRERKNIFSYHNHDFHLKKTKQDEVVITTNDGEIVAEVIIEGDECLVEVIEEKKSFVENFSGKVAPEIVNGKLVNYEQFKGNRVVTTDSEGR